MYESVGRRGGVARARPIPTEAITKTSPGKNKAAESPYWTNMETCSQLDSDDHDSAVYDELDKQSSRAPSSHAGTPQTLPKQKPPKRQAPPPPPPQAKHDAQLKTKDNNNASAKPAALSIELQSNDEESDSVYTHVWGDADIGLFLSIYCRPMF